MLRPSSNAIRNATGPSASLPDDTYRIEVLSGLLSEEAGGNVAFNGGVDFASTFTLDRAAQVLSVVPQPVERNADGSISFLRDRIDVYFDDQLLDLNDAANENFYRLVDANTGDLIANPDTATYHPEQSRVELAFTAGDLDVGNYRLDIGSSESDPVLQNEFSIIGFGDNNSSFDTATQIDNSTGTIGKGVYRVASQIEPQTTVPQPPFPGGLDYPSHRTIQIQNHYKPEEGLGPLNQNLTGFVPLEDELGSQEQAPDASSSRVVSYWFPEQFPPNVNGIDGDVYQNFITEGQKDIVRGILDIYARSLGYEFVERDDGGLTIGRGDLRAAGPDADTSAAGLGGADIAILNFETFDGISTFGDGFTGVMFHEIGHSLGLGHNYEQHARLGFGPVSDTDPGAPDLVHLQRLAPPVSTDIDLFRFDLATAGRVQIETFAERLETPSLLNTQLRLFQRDPLFPNRSQEIAGNYSFFGNDSFIDVELEAGEYFVGVSSAGNDQYNPASPNSGFGGSTFGDYELQLTFEPELMAGQQIRDVSGTAIDGDADGTAGGVHSFWFQSDETAEVIFVDKLATSAGDGSLATPFREIDDAIAVAESRDDEILVPDLSTTNFAELNGLQFTVRSGGVINTFTFGTTGLNPIDLTAAADAAEAAATISARINSVLGSGTTSSSTDDVLSVAASNLIDLDEVSAFVFLPKLIRIVGNAVDEGVTGTLATDDPLFNQLADLESYQVGVDPNANVLADGQEFRVPRGTTVMIDAGVLLKMRAANIDVGTSGFADTNRQSGALQLLGTPTVPVYMRSYHDDTAGGETDGNDAFAPTSGDFGGIVFREDSDLEARGIFLNYVNHADINQGGGKVFVNAVEENFAPIHILDARPTVRFSTITNSADVAMLATPDSFEETVFDNTIQRVGPEISSNFLQDNGTNGLLIFIRTDGSGITLDPLTVPGRFDDDDITHVIEESLVIEGSPGGPTLFGTLQAREAGRLVVDPGVVVKLDGARIEAERGQSNLIAEGTEDEPVIFTSILDDRFGGSGSFDVNRDPGTTGTPGDWAGIIFGEASSGSIDHALIAYGGGDSEVPGVDGGSSNFNVIEIHQADVRIANSELTLNADGDDNGAGASALRGGVGRNAAATIYVRGSQPVIVGNQFIDNLGPAISINVNALNHEYVVDPGRQTGRADAFSQFDDNRGPLIRINELDNNAVNGLDIRSSAEVINRFDDVDDFTNRSPINLVLNDYNITTEVIWDDTDIVHVVNGELSSGNLSTYGGIRMLSSVSESLVVKVNGANAGFTATGTPIDISDRIGGTIHVVGQPGFPVIITELDDDSVGAGYSPSGEIVFDTGNNGATTGSPGAWRGFLFDEFSNDRNVALIAELEPALTSGNELNDTPSGSRAQDLGTLADDQKSGDENRRLGFEVMGFISPDAPDDVDVYSFRATTQTEVWIDLDRTGSSLDGVVELIDNVGNVLASSSDPNVLTSGTVQANPLTENSNLGGDFYTLNHKDPGMRVVLPGVPNQLGQYFVRVRSADGVTSGAYRMQIRLQQVDEFPGSTIRFADIRYATTAIDVEGLPSNSFLTGDAREIGDAQAELGAGAQELINLLQSDTASLSIAGEIANATDIDVYQIEVAHIPQPLSTPPTPTVAVVFDIDYADEVSGLDSTIAVFNSNNELVFIGRESNIADDLPGPDATDGRGLDDLARGSVGERDPYIGPVHLIPGDNYYVAVMSDQSLPASAAVQFYTANPNGGPEARLTRLEPVNSVQRIVEDHIGFSGYTSRQDDDDTPGRNEEVRVLPTTPSVFDISSTTAIDTHVVDLDLSDVPLFLITDRDDEQANGTDDNLYIADALNGGDPIRDYFPVDVGDPMRDRDSLNTDDNDIQDIVIRSDGRMFGYARLDGNNGSVGTLVELDPNTGLIIASQNDGILGVTPTPNTSAIDDDAGSHAQRALEFMDSDEVDALTFERTGATGNTPDYLTYYSVREFASNNLGANNEEIYPTSRLYLGRENGDASPRTSATGDDFGFLGEIQPDTVTTSSASFTFQNVATPNPARTNIFVRSKLPGENGTFRINLNRVVDGTTEITSFVNNMDSNIPSVINIELDITGTPATGGPTAQTIVNLINNDEDVSQMVIAVIAGGNANNAGDGNGGTQGITGGSANVTHDDGVGTPIGRVTGLSFSRRIENNDADRVLYGVTEDGHFIQIDKTNGDATVLAHDPTLRFAGLALGPENVTDGLYRNMLFATTTSGQLFAFDPEDTLGRGTGLVGGFEARYTPAPIFAGNTNNVTITSATTAGSNPERAVGVAFSPSDFNLWHPTMRRAGDAGHGINAAPDGSRTGRFKRHAIPGDLATGDQNPTEASGGASWYFGLETWDSTPNSGSNKYLNPAPGTDNNHQFGISEDLHADLSSNPRLNNSYDLPGGALGLLDSGTFDLAGFAPEDRPTLYFNYFLETQNAPGVNSDDADRDFRDSARVYARSDQSSGWELVATNNSDLTVANDFVAELPQHLSHLSNPHDASDANQQAETRRTVQELHENTGLWRQARIDLSTFAGDTNIQLRFGFSTIGSSRDVLEGDQYGIVNDPDNDGVRDNDAEGFYVDDLIVGFAERGEMVTGAPANSSADAFVNLAGNSRTNLNNTDLVRRPQLDGEYQLEVRRTDFGDGFLSGLAGNQANVIQRNGNIFSSGIGGGDYARAFNTGSIYIAQTFDTNARHILETGGSNLLADQNVQRSQGLLLLESNIIRDSSTVGIHVQPGRTAGDGDGVTYPGPLRNFEIEDTTSLIPGVIVLNNVIVGGDGINLEGPFNGDPDDNPLLGRPYARLVNNTILGDGTGVGLNITDNASPIVINNVFADLTTGITNAGSDPGTEIENNLFVTGVGGFRGTNPIVAQSTDPLFAEGSPALARATSNFYLAAGAAALDESEDASERSLHSQFKALLDIDASPVLTPDRDALGQVRANSGGSTAGTVDLGAIDRVDTRRPFASLLIPTDNDNAGEDTDPTATNLRLTNPVLEAFSILLSDGENVFSKFEGTGIDPTTVDAASVTVRRNGQDLTEGEDFKLGFNSASGELRLTPVSDLWQPSSVYEIRLDNTLIADRAGNLLRPNRLNGTTRFTIILPTVQLDFGDAPESYGTVIADDGARHAVIDDGVLRLGSRIDDEAESWRASLQHDDDRINIGFTPTTASAGTFTTTNVDVGVEALGIESLPAPGDTLQVTETLGDDVTFEFVVPGTAPTGDNIAVAFDVAGTTDELAAILADAIAKVFIDFGADIEIDVALADTVGGTPATITLSKLDDEDGLGISFLTSAGHHVFVDPDVVTDETFTESGDVIGFLNPQDPRGAAFVLNASAAGFVDAWIDFDGNGVFDEATETILDSVAVVAGRNEFTVFTPEGTTDKDTWARFRISPEGNSSPTGLVIGGEVEDYEISIVNVALPIAMDDEYTTEEDEFLDSTIQTFNPNQSIVGNDTTDAARFTPLTFVLVDDVQYGTLELNTETGTFTYDPVDDFAGWDTFTYYLADQNSGYMVDPVSGDPIPTPALDVNGDPVGIGTVTIDVTPVNDQPAANDVTLIALEDDQLGDRVYTANDLFNLIAEDGDPLFPGFPDPNDSTQTRLDPWNEQEQDLSISAISTAADGTIVSPGGTAPVATGPHTTPHGQIYASWDDQGALIQITYVPNENFNRDRDKMAVGDADILDTFSFTVQDDGELTNPRQVLDPATGLLDESDDVSVAGTPMSVVAQAFINVRPRNDAPVTMDDVISENNTSWNDYFDNLDPAENAPTPTEDTTLVIPAGYVLENDGEAAVLAVAADSANDEINVFVNNDTGLDIVEVGLLDTGGLNGRTNLGGTVEIINGDIVFTPADETYGLDFFVYKIEDRGITFDSIDPAATPIANGELEAFGTISILIKPVNDAPEVAGQSFTLQEYQELENVTGAPNPDDKDEVAGIGLLEITASDLLQSAREVALPPEFPDARFDENAQDLRVRTITTPGANGGTVDAGTLTYDLVSGLAINPDGNAAPSDPIELETENGVLRLTFSLVQDPMDVTSFLPGSGHFVSGVFEPNVDYNQEDPFTPKEDTFTYTVEDFGEIPVPGAADVGEPTETTGHGSIQSLAATVTITTQPVNDVPFLPLYATVELDEDRFFDADPMDDDRPDGDQVVVPNIFMTPGEMILPGAITALDELAVQTVTIDVNAVNVPSGMFTTDPVLLANGQLTFTPAPDAFGVAVFEVVVTDSVAVPDQREVRRQLTIDIAPINDQPTTDNRSYDMDELQERENGTGADLMNPPLVFTIPEDDLLNLNGTGPGAPALSSDVAPQNGMIEFDEFDENEQTLRVVAYQVIDQDGTAIGDPVDIDTIANEIDPETGQPAVSPDGQFAIRDTVAGRFRFDFNNDDTRSVTFTPNVDYNSRTPFVPSQMFTYTVEDVDRNIAGSDQVSVPGTGFTNGTGTNDLTTTHGNTRSVPATVTLVVNQVNDVPFLPEFGSIPDSGGLFDVGTIHLTEDLQFGSMDPRGEFDPVVANIFRNGEMILPGPATALDEIEFQTDDMVIRLEPVNVPNAGAADDMFLEDPELDANGELTFTPRRDAFGIAVFDVVVEDFGSDQFNNPDSRTIRRRLTIDIAPVNDPPTAERRQFDVDEIREFQSGTDEEPTNDPPAQLTITADQLLDLSGPAPARTSGVARPDGVDSFDEFDEDEQTLRIIRIGLPNVTGTVFGGADPNVIDITVDEFSDASNRSMENGVGFALRETTTGNFRFEFDGVGLTQVIYTPHDDYNERDPFESEQLFTYILADGGEVSIPGSGFTNDPPGANEMTTGHGSLESAPATVTITVNQTNDPPFIPQFISQFTGPNTVTLREDEIWVLDRAADPTADLSRADGTAVVVSIFDDPTQRILPGPEPSSFIDPIGDLPESEQGARDENEQFQSIDMDDIQVVPVSVPVGMFDVDPVLSPDGQLTFTPAPDAFGIAVFQVIVSDEGVDQFDAPDPLTSIRNFTINIEAVNDAPVAFTRDFELQEYQEQIDVTGDPNTATVPPRELVITESELLNGTLATELPALKSDFADGMEDFDEFDEDGQTLRVVAVEVLGAIDALGDPADGTVDVAIDGSGIAIRQTNQGVFEFEFDGGGLITAQFTPNTDYNRTSPFAPEQLFTYTVEDIDAADPSSVQVLNPGSGAAADPPGDNVPTVTHNSERSAPATVTITVFETNDVPFLPNYPIIDATEDLDADGNPRAPGDLITIENIFGFDVDNNPLMVLPGPATALDEIEDQDVTISVVPINVPANMFTFNPRLTADGDLTFRPAENAFGVSVWEVVVVDNGESYFGNTQSVGPDVRTLRRPLTIDIAAVNDPPVAEPRRFQMTEYVELEEGTGLPKDPQEPTEVVFTLNDLIEGDSAFSEDRASVNAFADDIDNAPEFDEDEQTLNVPFFSVPTGFGTTFVSAANSGVPITTNNGGTLTFNFDAGGQFTNGIYRPATDYNRLTGPLPTEQFSYFIQDQGELTIPGAAFAGLPTTTSGHGSQFSAPEIITINVLEANDVPDFADPVAIEFDEDLFAPGVPVPSNFFGPTGGMILPAPLTASDEQTQLVTLAITQVGGPTNIFPTLPTVDLDGSIEFLPAANAYGVVEFAITAEDNGRDASGTLDRKSVTKTLTVTVNPVNDRPAATNQSFQLDELREELDDGSTASVSEGNGQLTVTAAEILELGTGGPAEEHDDPSVDALFDESDQELAIASISVAGGGTLRAADLSYSGGVANEVLDTANGLLELTFVDPANGEPPHLSQLIYTPDVDYASASPFAATDIITYTVVDFGEVTLPGPGGLVSTGHGSLESLPGQIQFTVNPVNDTPQFTFRQNVTVLERDDLLPTVVQNWASDVQPGLDSARDELAAQTVNFTFEENDPATAIPGGIGGANSLFTQAPTVSPQGTLMVYPAPDQTGSAVVVFSATDDDASDPTFVPLTKRVTFTINVEPVNDPPILNPATVPTAAVGTGDDIYEVRNDGTLVLTLREDNVDDNGIPQPYRIDLAQNGGGRPGLLDLFLPGPPNEVAAGQTLSLDQFPTTTVLGGTLSEIRENGQLVALAYDPPQHVNSANNQADSFTYRVSDDGVTFDVIDDQLGASPLTINGRVEFVLNPVNDRPTFDLLETNVDVDEDDPAFSQNGFVFNISGGPQPVASDEFSGANAQTMTFAVVPVGLTPEQYAAAFPTPLSVSANGQLQFETGPNVFGDFEFDVTATDDGDDLSAGRGDLNESLPRRLTVSVHPINDPPVAVGGDSITVSAQEDQPASVGVAEMLANFAGGPAAAEAGLPNEADEQSLFVTGVPTTTTAGGTLTPQMDNGGAVIGYDYVPFPDFAGQDSFVYQVSDGDANNTTPATVLFDVLPVNDAPILGAVSNVFREEDPGAVVEPNWITSVEVGPAGALDELNGLNGTPAQTIDRYEFTFVSGTPGLFDTSIVPDGLSVNANGDLLFTVNDDISGAAVFDVVAVDDGPSDAVNGDVDTSAPQRFTITVGDVNDPPSFTNLGQVDVPEDSGAYDELWAENITPGSPAEISDGQTVSFDVTVPVEQQVLFTQQPTIDSNGQLRFELAPDATGTATITVVARDSVDPPAFSEAQTLTIVIENDDDSPMPVEDAFTTSEDVTLTFTIGDLLSNDVDLDPGDVLTFVPIGGTDVNGSTVITTTEGARVTITGETIEYEPLTSNSLQQLRPGQTAADTFTYGVVDSDGEDVIPTAIVTLNVEGRNDAPLANPDGFFIEGDGPTTIAPQLNDTDVDGVIDPDSLIVTVEPQFGTLAENNGVLTYLPGPNFTGLDTFQYTIADDLGQASEAGVVSLYSQPAAGDIMVGTSVDRSTDVDVSGFFPAGIPLDTSSILIVEDPDNGMVELVNGELVYTPDTDYTGPDSFVFTIADQDGNRSDPTTVNLNIVGSRLQNPVDFSDVNRNGEVTALDALLVINRLNSAGNVTSIPVTDADFGIGTNDGVNEQFYYDQSGDGQISPLDALRVINEINRRDAQSEPAGEPIDAIASDVATTIGTSPAVVQDAPGTASAGAAKIVGGAEADEDVLVEVIALDQVAESDSSEATANPLDSAIKDLF
ncbi:MAG: Ig-like domain-containing protein [Planctomycetota bacterium]